MFLEIFGTKYLVDGHVRTRLTPEGTLESLGIKVNDEVIKTVEINPVTIGGAQYHRITLAAVAQDDELQVSPVYITEADYSKIK